MSVSQPVGPISVRPHTSYITCALHVQDTAEELKALQAAMHDAHAVAEAEREASARLRLQVSCCPVSARDHGVLRDADHLSHRARGEEERRRNLVPATSMI
jgi:hypothetical protein